MKITHIITGLSRGGAEAVLTRLVMSDDSNTHEVIVLKDKGAYGDELVCSGVNVYSLGMTHGLIGIKSVVNLYRYLRKSKPDIVQTWMFHADLIGGVVAMLSGIKKIFWGVHAATVEKQPIKIKIIVRLCSLLSYFVPTKVICCGIKAKQVMSDNFYNKSKLLIVHNGYDTNLFANDGNVISRNVFSCEISQDDFLIGFVARWDKHKDIPNLLSALKYIVDDGVKIQCVFVGIELEESNTELCKLIDSIGLFCNIHLLGCRNDISDFMRTVDICVLSSITEAFPNVLAESMACGTPCVTTDVGDAKVIVGNTGWVVPHSNPKALGGAIIEAVSEKTKEKQWDQRKKECRDRIVDNFSLNNMVKNYNEIWNS
jgi:glycosyltransferase involved in cell wall biosynthesis